MRWSLMNTKMTRKKLLFDTSKMKTIPKNEKNLSDTVEKKSW